MSEEVKFEPELGQEIFGQPHKEFSTSHKDETAILAVGAMLEEILNGENPTLNSGARYHGKIFTIEAYSWSDDDQPFNFKWRDFEASWYKWAGRGGSCNRHLSELERVEMLNEISTEIYEDMQARGVRVK